MNFPLDSEQRSDLAELLRVELEKKNLSAGTLALLSDLTTSYVKKLLNEEVEKISSEVIFKIGNALDKGSSRDQEVTIRKKIDNILFQDRTLNEKQKETLASLLPDQSEQLYVLSLKTEISREALDKMKNKELDKVSRNYLFRLSQIRGINIEETLHSLKDNN